MGRTARCITALCALCLLTGCFPMPDDINTEISTTSIYLKPESKTTTLNTVVYGDEAFIVDEGGELVNVYTGTQASTQDPVEYFATMPTATAATTEYEPEEIEFEPITSISFETADIYDDVQLTNYYGSKNNLGYYDDFGNFYCTETGQFGESTELSFSDAVKQYTSAYGEPDISLSKNKQKFAYWFEDDFVYCVIEANYEVSLSVSKYYSDTSFYYVLPEDREVTIDDVVESDYSEAWITTLLYNEYGRPYHEDFYNYIFRAQDYYYVIGRDGYSCTISRR